MLSLAVPIRPFIDRSAAAIELCCYLLTKLGVSTECELLTRFTRLHSVRALRGSLLFQRGQQAGYH